MKYFKYLVILLAVSFISCMTGVKANTSDPYWFARNCPALNGGVYTDNRLKQELHTQELRWTATERELDVVLQDKTGTNRSPWYILETGEDIIFSNTNAMYPGIQYRIFVDSRITYFSSTFFEFKWWIH